MQFVFEISFSHLLCIMLPSVGAMSDQSTLKNLLSQLLSSGMSIPQENQSIDYRRLQEELLRSSHDVRGLDRANRGFSYRDISNQGERENYDFYYRNERNETLNQDRSNFFGGALERKDTRGFTDLATDTWSQKGKWQQSGGFDREWENRRQEMMGMRDGKRKSRRDDMERDSRGSSFFSTSLGSAPNILSSLQLPSALPSRGSTLENLHSVGSDMWSASNDQSSMGYMYGMENNFLAPDSASLRPYISAFEAPPPGMPKPSTSEKPDGCHTIFIGGLPESVNDDIIREIFSMCGAIQTIRTATGKSGKNFCHVRFVDPQSVDLALGYSGYRLTVTKDGKMSGGRIHVDYAKSREDEKDYEKLLREKAREVRQQSEMEDKVVLFTERAANDLMRSIRSDSGFFEAFETLALWLERGECTRKTSSTFYNLLSSVHSHVRRLIKEKREHEEIVERQKQEQYQRVKQIMSQGTSILRVFNAASKKKCWDHFSKAQRRNVGDWHQQVEKAIKLSAEEQMENRVEVGMDIDDEVDHIQNTSESSQPEDENTGEPDAKQPKLEESSASESEKTQVEDSTAQGSLEAKTEPSLDGAAKAAQEANDMKYRAQVAGLKALAEKNTSLMWQVESYKNEILVLKQRFASVFQDKDLQIARLISAVQALQNFLHQANFNTDATKVTNVEVEITKEASDLREVNFEKEAADGDVFEFSEIESAEMVDEAPATDEDEEGKESEGELRKTELENTVEKTTIGSEVASDMVKESNCEANQPAEDDKIENDKDAGDSMLEEDSEKKASEDETTSANVTEKADDSDNTRVCLEDDPEADNETTQVSEEKGKSSSAHVIRLSSNQMVVVGFLCSYLQICPYGATTEQVLTHIRRQVPGVTLEDLENILNSLPMLFSGTGLEFMNKTWKFNVLNM